MLGKYAIHALTAGFCILLPWEFYVSASAGKADLRVLVQEFGRISVDGGGDRLSSHQMSKFASARVDATYSSTLSCSRIYSLYDAELARNGWGFAGGRLFDGWSSRNYRKGSYTAHVNCKTASWDWKYTFEVLSDAPQKGQNGPMALLGVILTGWAALVWRNRNTG